MIKRSKNVGVKMLATLLLLAGASVSWAQATGGTVTPFGGELRGIMKFSGKVVCLDCTISEVHKADPQLPNLYLLKRVGHEQQQAVVSIDTISEPQRWDAVVFPHEVLVRSTDALFQKLTAEANFYKPVSVTGLLRNDRIMDVQDVTVME